MSGDAAYWAERCTNCGRKRSEHSIPFEYTTLGDGCKEGFQAAPKPPTELEKSIDAYFRGEYLFEKK